MEWTKETPTKEGTYWHTYSDLSKPSTCDLYRDTDGKLKRAGMDGRTAGQLKGYWYGPIEPPALPKREELT